MAVSELDAVFRAIVPLTWRGARAKVWYDRAKDSCRYGIVLRNGAAFEDKDAPSVFRQASVYAQSVENLTGEQP